MKKLILFLLIALNTLTTSSLVLAYDFTSQSELQTAVDLWISDNASALSTHGDIKDWNVSSITDMYALLRMFKDEFESTKHQKHDKCDSQKYFKNIIYVGGVYHANVINRFIFLYFGNKNADIGKNISQEKSRCVEFDEPVVFFSSEIKMPV